MPPIDTVGSDADRRRHPFSIDRRYPCLRDIEKPFTDPPQAGTPTTAGFFPSVNQIRSGWPYRVDCFAQPANRLRKKKYSVNTA